ncbi:hypothetical protein ADK38_02405 [Streptomyces varsoviensis]|uniref:Uncharacterized protein n=1 Tax=Streptomyces varsoviensis TaxID=67373 RepID=A0ABR5JDU6_9ACTN|nr:hypothetical protein ADK38_02405 [Streptomyces varsoviensis]
MASSTTNRSTVVSRATATTRSGPAPSVRRCRASRFARALSSPYESTPAAPATAGADGRRAACACTRSTIVASGAGVGSLPPCSSLRSASVTSVISRSAVRGFATPCSSSRM